MRRRPPRRTEASPSGEAAFPARAPRPPRPSGYAPRAPARPPSRRRLSARKTPPRPAPSPRRAKTARRAKRRRSASRRQRLPSASRAAAWPRAPFKSHFSSLKSSAETLTGLAARRNGRAGMRAPAISTYSRGPAARRCRQCPGAPANRSSRCRGPVRCAHRPSRTSCRSSG